MWHLAKEMAMFGHHVEVAVPADGTLSQRAGEKGIPCHIVNIRSSLVTDHFLVKRLLDFKGLIDLHHLYRSGRFDIIHLNLLRARVLGRLASLLHGARGCVVSTIHGIDLENPFYYAMECMTNWVDRYIVAVSEDTKKYLISKGFNVAKLRVIHNGLDLESADQVPVNRELLYRELRLNGVPLVGLVAYLYPHVKGHEVFLRAARRVLQRNGNIHFVIVGDVLYPKDGYYRKQLERYAVELGIAPSVHFLGTRSDIYNIMDSLDVIVLPSNVREGFGMVLIEAMARRKPVIGSRIGGITDVIQDGINGLLFTSGDDLDLAEAILSIVENPESAKRFGEAGRQRVEREFSSKVMARKYEELFHEVAWSRAK